MKKIIILLSSFMLGACTSHTSVFTEFMDKDKVCSLVSDDLIKTIFNAKGQIEKTGKFSDSLFKGFIGNNCDISWRIKEDEEKGFSFTLISLKPDEDFPPKKLSHEQLLKKIALVNKQTEAYISNYDQATIDHMRKSNADGIKSHNDYQVIDGLGDIAIISELVTNDDAYMQSSFGDLVEKKGDVVLYRLSVKSGNILLEASLSTAIINKPKEKLIQLTTLIFERK
jgi:hypothetical protein